MLIVTKMKKVPAPAREKKDPGDAARLRQKLMLDAMEIEAQIHDLRAASNIVNPHERGAHRYIATLVRSKVKSLRKEWAEK